MTTKHWHSIGRHTAVRHTFKLFIVLVVDVPIWVAPLAQKAAFMVFSHMLPQLILPIVPLVAEPVAKGFCCVSNVKDLMADVQSDDELK